MVGGSHPDRDGDGLVDSVDNCPDQPETVDGFTDEDGCPELDGDGDGVPFERDICPREAIYPEQDPRYSDGCPKLAALAGERITVADPVFFEEASVRILPGAIPVLNAVYQEIVDHPEVMNLLIEGHTNNNGSARYNYDLAERRARAVAEWLVDKGVDRNLLIHKGYGFDRPLLPHSHPDAKTVNRRVVFTVMRPEEMRVGPTAPAVVPRPTPAAAPEDPTPVNDLIQEGLNQGEEADAEAEESAPNVEEPTEPVSEETGSSGGEDVSGEDAPAEDAPAEDAPAEDDLAEDAPAEDDSAANEAEPLEQEAEGEDGTPTRDTGLEPIEELEAENAED